MKSIAAIAGCLCLVAASVGQSQSLREWTNYTDVRDVTGINSVGDSLYLATGGGLVRILQGEPSVEWHFTNADGLGDNRLRFVTVDSSGFVWTGGENGRLCRRRHDKRWDTFVFEDENGLPIRLNAASPGPDGFLWVASDKGVHKFDTRRHGGEIKESYTRIGGWPDESRVNDILIEGGKVYSVGEAGFAHADVDDPNLLDRSHWASFTVSGAMNAVTVLNGVPILGGDHELTRHLGGDVFEIIPVTDPFTLVRDLDVKGDTLWVAFENGYGRMNPGAALNSSYIPDAGPSGITSVHCTESGVWFGQLRQGAWQLDAGNWNHIEFNCTLDNLLIDVALDPEGRLWAMHSFTGGDVLDDGVWTKLPYINVGPGAPGQAVDIAPDGDVWYAAWGGGVWRINRDDPLNEDLVTNFKKPNSSLMWVQDADEPREMNYVVAEELAVGPDGKVWVCNSFADSGCVIAFYDGGCWGRFKQNDGLRSNRPIALLPLDGSLLVGFANIGLLEVSYDEPLCTGGTQRPQTLRVVQRTTADDLPSNQVRAMVVDGNDSLWVGTNLGLVRYARDRRRFFAVELPPEAGLTVNALAVDPTNSIWVGTTFGLAIVAADGTVDFYNSRNSGLVGDDVADIEFDDKTGDVWIATRAGLSRTRGPLPAAASTENIVAYPNPFVIGGEVEHLRFNAPPQSRVYITTVAGHPVLDLDASFGWDGRNSSGTFVASGVYLFVVRGPDDSFGRGKIAVFNRR